MITLEDKENSDCCAYRKICKGICSSPSSCIRNNKTDEEIYKEIQDGMVAKGRLDRIRHYLETTDPKNVRIDIVLRWATI